METSLHPLSEWRKLEVPYSRNFASFEPEELLQEIQFQLIQLEVQQDHRFYFGRLVHIVFSRWQSLGLC
jgi:hypothetical protein